MISELPYALIIAVGVCTSLHISNVAFDYGVPNYLSRKTAHMAGAAGFLLCPLLFTTFWWPFLMAVGFTAVLLCGRIFRPRLFRGVGGSGRQHAIAEVHFPGTAIVLIGVVWGILHQPWLAIVPLAFLGAGDGITGIVRSWVYGLEVKGLWGSAAMLAVCLLLAYFIRPYWVGAAGAVAATLAEKFTKTSSYIDDNFTIPLFSAVVMGVLWYVSKGF